MTKPKPPGESNGRRWTTPAQLLWLIARIPDYLAAREAKVLTDWYQKTYAAFFREFPLEVTPEEEAFCDGDTDTARLLEGPQARRESKEKVRPHYII